MAAFLRFLHGEIRLTLRYLAVMKAKVSVKKRAKKRTTSKRAVPLASSSWVDALHGSARFTEAELEEDERLKDLVEGARTKPTQRVAKRA
jgi:hypothetical protein